MGDFKNTYFGQYSEVPIIETHDSKFWTSYEPPVIMKEFGLIDSINVTSIEPYFVAVTSGYKVEVFNPRVLSVVNTIAQFKTKAHGAIFRNDGQLIAVGCETGHVKLFDYNRKHQLRQFSGHSSTVKKVAFIPNTSELVSFSQDHTIKLWDIPTEANMNTFKEHEGALRVGLSNPSSSNLFLSGSEDKTVKMWDTRVPNSTLTFNHGFSVEAALFFKNGSCFAVAGGSKIQIYDLVAGKSIKSFTNHHKTITSLALGDNGLRLLSGSIDKQVKVYNMKTYQQVKNVHLDYPGEILSLGSTPSSDTLIVGMGDNGSGVLSFQKKPEDTEEPQQKKLKPAEASYLNDKKARYSAQPLREKKYDKFLRKFQRTKALQASLDEKDPEVTVAVLYEIIRRQKLKESLAAQTVVNLRKIVRFLVYNISNPIYSRILVHTSKVLLEVYIPEILESKQYQAIFRELEFKVKHECQLLKMEGDLVNSINLAMQFHKHKDMEEKINLKDQPEKGKQNGHSSDLGILVNIS